MPRYIITLPDETIDHEGFVELNGGALILKDGGRLSAAYGQGEWREVVADGKAPTKEPIPSSNNAMRVLFEGDHLSALVKLSTRWGTTPDRAAIKAVSDALANEDATTALRAEAEIQSVKG